MNESSPFKLMYPYAVVGSVFTTKQPNGLALIPIGEEVTLYTDRSNITSPPFGWRYIIVSVDHLHKYGKYRMNISTLALKGDQ